MQVQEPAPGGPHDGLYGGARTLAMLAVALSVLLSVIDYAIANVALPTIAHDIHASPSSSIWVINAYQLASVISILPLAAVGDRIGYARMCRIGLALFVLASLLCAASTTLLELSLARALQGFGGACIMSVNAALLRFIYPHRIIGRGIALNGLVIAAGVALGPTIAAGVLSVANWPWLFLINLPLGGVALLFAITSLPRTPTRDTRFDGRSAVLNALAFGSLIVSFDRLAHGDGPIGSVALLGFGTICLVALVRRQLGRPDPLLPIDLLLLGGFRAAVLTGFLGFVASNFFIISMPFTLEDVLGRTAVQTGLLITPWPLAIVVVAPFIGRLSDRAPAAVISTIGLLMVATGFCALWLMPARPSDLDIAWRIGLAGAGFGVFQPPNNRAMLVAAPVERAGSASGMISVARLLGQTVGAMLVAMTFALLGSSANRACLALASATALCAAGISASRLRTSRTTVAVQ
ncbi:MFS transporter [Lichenicola sp.]|uniref:MFS transporter n=1 Tax=Lichenicola sp. TaxID=2804529 RepID=UPI003B00C414